MSTTTVSVTCAKSGAISQIKYLQIRKIGSGAFGEVFSIALENTNVYAMKTVFEKKTYVNREISILKMISHPCIVQMLWYFYGDKKKDGQELNIIMEYVKYDLCSLISTNYIFTRKNFLLYAIKLLSAIEYLHSKSIMHRDIKPSNILIDTERKLLKLCDFGSAKIFIPGEPNITYICSRSYRAPELHQNLPYTHLIDVWSAGCVLAEMLTHKLLFTGPCSASVLQSIKEKLPLIAETIFRESSRSDMNDVIKIIEKMLTFNPNKRITASDAKKRFISLQ